MVTMIKEKKKNDDAIPMSVYDVHGVYLKTLDGEWLRYEYKDVRGIIEPDGQYKGVFGGKEYLLLDGINYPKIEWKEDLYIDLLYIRDIDLYKKAHLRQLSNRELTKALKHNWLLFEQIDDMTIEVKVNKQFIMDCLESQMQDLYLYERFWKRWYDLHLHNKGAEIPFKLTVYGMEFDMTIEKNRIEEYCRAAKEVANRLNAYTVFFKGRKTEHQIALMTMIDLAVYPFLNHSETDEKKIEIELSVCDETIKVIIKESDRELYERSAIRITERYNRYLECYRSRPIEAIERMTLLDIYFRRMKWRHKNFMDYLIAE